MSFYQRERNCEDIYGDYGPYWHLCTPGQITEILCETDEDYRFCVTIVGLAAAVAKVRVLTFEIMSNHIHIVLSGEEKACFAFFDYYKDKLRRHYLRSERYKRMEEFVCQLIPVTSLEMLRIEIVYTNRNGYVVNDKYTPFSYPWGAGHLYFAFNVEGMPGRKYSDLSYREKRVVCHGQGLELPESYEVYDGMLLPRSFSDYKLGEALFRDAHQYFSMVSKNMEVYSQVAERLGDSVFLTDDELFSVVARICKKQHNEERPSMLPNSAKLEIARKMKREYNASIGQIQRMLRLDRSVVAELFGR